MFFWDLNHLATSLLLPQSCFQKLFSSPSELGVPVQVGEASGAPADRVVRFSGTTGGFRVWWCLFAGFQMLMAEV